MTQRWTITAAALLLAALVPAAVAQTPAGQPSVQQQFDAASAALQQQAWDEALRVFETLEARLLALGNKRSLALVRVRKAEALVGLRRDPEAEQAIRLGLPALPTDDTTLREDRYLAFIYLGEIAERALDYGEALNNYRAAQPLAPDLARSTRAVRGLIQTGMFHDAPAALDRANAAIAAAMAEAPRSKRLEASFRTLKGRVLLNLGRFAEARTELKQAVELLGGLSRKVDAADLAARSDLAIAALLDGADEEARKYLAWTGAGHWPEAFARGSEMKPPPCGGEVRPDDVAVVEFSILDDGSIGHATPVYSSRQGSNALAFARAVAGWSWPPERLTEIPLLFRTLTRVELRCSTASEPMAVTDLLRAELDQWLLASGHPASPGEGRSDARRLKPLQEALALTQSASAGRDSLALLPILADLADNSVAGEEERRDALVRGLALARTHDAPATALAWLAVNRARPEQGWGRAYYRKYAESLRGLLGQPDIARDSRAAAAVRVELADALYRASDEAAAAAMLNGTLRESGLAAADPLGKAAQARLAAVLLAAGKAAEARAALAAAGLRSDQCELLDSPPRLRNSATSSSDFPIEALRWGFEGWALIEFDIDAEGNTHNPRTAVAYPPFVFGKAASKLVERFRFDPVLRPQGSRGCGGLLIPVNFRVPREPRR
jgi:tetratricopeptide (TPR) repeat protein